MKRRIGATLAALAVTALSILFAAPAHADSAGPLYIWSANSHRCLNVPAGSGAENVQMIQWDCVVAFNNRWLLFDDGSNSGISYIQSQSSILCLVPLNDGTANGTPIVQVNCEAHIDDNAAKWIHQDGGFGTSYLRSLASGRCLNVQGGDTGNGAKIILWDCVNALNNKWLMTTTPPTS